jgi:hypothetical protein
LKNKYTPGGNPSVHKQVKKVIIGRHNKAGQFIMKAIGKGRLGNDVIMADVCSQQNVESLLPGTLTTRIPDWLLPNLDESVKKKLRPDGMLLCHREYVGLRYKKFNPYKDEINKNWPIKIVEIKYTSDTDQGAKVLTACQQHARLLKLLCDDGWKDVQVIPVCLGVSGTITKTVVDNLRELGVVDVNAMDRLLTKLHFHAVDCLHSLVVLRRQLEVEMGSGPAG